jgi:hypothetical protein
MKRLALIFILIFIFASFIHSQDVIENPEKPIRKNAGRVLKLNEVLRIRDTGKDYYFRYPSHLMVSDDGCLFIKDIEQLLKFSPEGKFIKDLYKKGQGPGEIDSSFNYHIFKDEIFIYDFTAVKIIHTDLEGNLIKQIKIESGPYNGFYGAAEDWYIFEKDIFPPSNERKSRLQDMPFSIRLVSKDGKTEKESCIFQRIMFLSPGGVTTWTLLFSVLNEDGKKLYVSHTNEYLIESLDLEKGQISKRFNRKYPRVKYIMRGWEDSFYKEYNVPEIKFESDVRGLFINNGLLWVKTSTADKKKGEMFDIFDCEGKFLDNFYLGVTGTLLAAHKDSIFVQEKDDDENLQIVQYKILE